MIGWRPDNNKKTTNSPNELTEFLKTFKLYDSGSEPSKFMKNLVSDAYIHKQIFHNFLIKNPQPGNLQDFPSRL